MVIDTHWLVHSVTDMLHANFQQLAMKSFVAMTILVMTYFKAEFQPEGPL